MPLDTVRRWQAVAKGCSNGVTLTPPLKGAGDRTRHRLTASPFAHPPSIARPTAVRAFVSLYSATNYGKASGKVLRNVCCGKRLQGRVGLVDRCAVRS
jgi:hypothetical protein